MPPVAPFAACDECVPGLGAQAAFTRRLSELCDVVTLVPSNAEGGAAFDYREQLRPADEPTYLSPLSAATKAAVDGRFSALTHGAARPTTLTIAGRRELELVASQPHGVAMASFEALCGRALGATDYIALAQAYHTIFITDLPQLSLNDRDRARRFITLVDQLSPPRAAHGALRPPCTFARCTSDHVRRVVPQVQPEGALHHLGGRAAAAALPRTLRDGRRPGRTGRHGGARV